MAFRPLELKVELIVLIVVLALAVAGGILIVSNLGLIIGIVALIFVGTVAHVLFGMTVLVPLAMLKEWFGNLPDETVWRSEMTVRWGLRVGLYGIV